MKIASQEEQMRLREEQRRKREAEEERRMKEEEVRLIRMSSFFRCLKTLNVFFWVIKSCVKYSSHYFG